MKKIFFVILIFIAIIKTTIVFSTDNSSVKIKMYYFHGSFRCFTCNNMEKFAREAIENNFKDILTLGKLEFKSVNVEEKGNEHFVQDYNLYTKALILSLEKDGKEVEYKNLDKIWQLASNKDKFIDYVSSQVREFINKV